jgi:group I intron endonuclease
VIYKAANRITGEAYVGQTKQKPRVRFRAHAIAARKPKTKFHAAIAQHGYENFEFVVLASCLTCEALNKTEKLFIAEYTPAYNSTCGGAGRPRKVSDEERARMSEDAKRRWANPEWKARTLATIRGNAVSGVYTEPGRRGGKTGIGARARWVGHTLKGKPAGDRKASMVASWAATEVRERRLCGLREANLREEVRERRSVAAKNRVVSIEAVTKMARSKWRPVYCPELETTFLSRSAAATFIGVGNTTISEALKHRRKVLGRFTLREVCH